MFNPETLNAAEEVPVASETGRCKDIFEAVSKGNLSEVERFVNEGVDINVKSCTYFLLTLAADRRETEIVRFLCQSGAYVEQKTRGFPNFSHVSELTSESVPAGFTPIFYAAHNGVATVKCLVEEFGANSNAKNGVGETPLFYAARIGNLEPVKYLCEDCHANVEAKNNWGETPIWYAISSENLDVVKYLCENRKATISKELFDLDMSDEIKEYPEQELQGR